MVLTSQVNPDPRIIDLGIGQPQESLLPLKVIAEAARLALGSDKNDFLQYGAEQGDGFLRLALAKFLAKGYGFPVSPADIFITNGASQALDLICTLFTKPGDTIYVEEPTYFLALKIFADHGLKTVGIPVNSHGIDLEILDRELKFTKPILFYTVPTFQNPSGIVLSLVYREKLAALSLEHQFMIVADEVYHFLYQHASPPMAFAGYLEQGNILSLGSFSKILAPGLRLGWILASQKLIQALLSCGLLDSGGGLNPFTSAIVRQIVESNELEHNIKKLRSVYTSRSNAVEHALTTYRSEFDFQKPEGGYFYWVKLTGGADAQRLLYQAENVGVSFRPGSMFSSFGGLNDCLRLSFTYYEENQLIQGIQRLYKVLKSQP